MKRFIILFYLVILSCATYPERVIHVKPEVTTREIVHKDTVYVYNDIPQSIKEINKKPNYKPRKPTSTTNITANKNKSFNLPVIKDPSPPERILIWMVIYEGRVYTHRVKKFDYPGTLKVSSHYVKNGHRVAILESSFKSIERWELILPTEDGEYYLTATLIH